MVKKYLFLIIIIILLVGGLAFFFLKSERTSKVDLSGIAICLQKKVERKSNGDAIYLPAEVKSQDCIPGFRDIMGNTYIISNYPSQWQTITGISGRLKVGYDGDKIDGFFNPVGEVKIIGAVLR